MRNVRVTQEDIDDGCVREPDNCPVARATARALQVDSVRVFRINNQKNTVVFEVPNATFINMYLVKHRKLAKFINSFDNREKVKPISFSIDCTDRR